jgi:hypothetical protein
MKNGRSGEQGVWRNARVVPVFRGRLKRKKEKAKIAFARILRGIMRKNKIRKRNVSPCTFEEYQKVYEKFWAEKKSVTPDDINFMVRLIEERTINRME